MSVAAIVAELCQNPLIDNARRGGLLPYREAQLAADVNLPAAAWTTVLSVTLTPGTWLVAANITINGIPASGNSFALRISDGTTVKTGSRHTLPANEIRTLNCMTIIVVRADTTWSAQVRHDNGVNSGTALYQTTVGTVIDGVSKLTAVRIQ